MVGLLYCPGMNCGKQIANPVCGVKKLNKDSTVAGACITITAFILPIPQLARGCIQSIKGALPGIRHNF